MMSFIDKMTCAKEFKCITERNADWAISIFYEHSFGTKCNIMQLILHK